MKKLIVVVVVLFTCFGSSVSAAETDSTKLDKIDTLKVELKLQNTIKIIKEQIELLQQTEDLNVKLDTIYSRGNYNYFYDKSKSTKFETFSIVYSIVFILIFILTFALIIWKLRGYDLKKALSEIKLIESTAIDAAGIQTKSSKEKMIESSSRLLAFLSGVVALGLSFALILISIYTFLNTGIIPDFSHLVNSVLALGIGIIPYSVNRVASSFKSNNT